MINKSYILVVMLSLHPYLVFNGTCEEAFYFYEKIFGGKVLYMGRYKDVPLATRSFFPGCTDEQIMHATLQIDAATVLMGNDSVATHEKPTGASGHTFFLYLRAETEADAYRIFDELSAGGEIIIRIAQTFWTTHYGIVTDKFGISWKITFEA
jgi:PhnB protein